MKKKLSMAEEQQFCGTTKTSNFDPAFTNPISSRSVAGREGRHRKMKKRKKEPGRATSEQNEDASDAAAATASPGHSSADGTSSTHDPLLQDLQELTSRTDSPSRSPVPSTSYQERQATLTTPLKDEADGSAMYPISQRPLRQHDKEQRVGVACILCLAASALATASAVALAVLRTQSKDFTESCSSFDCQMAARYMRSLTDTSIEPCKDFYSHVCRKWDSGAEGLNFLDMAVQDLETSLNWTLLSIGTGREQYYGAAELVRFYTSCHSYLIRAFKHGVEAAAAVALELLARDSSLLRLQDTQALFAQVIGLSLMRGLYTVLEASLVRHRDNVSIYLSRGQTLAEKLGERNETRLLNNYLRPLFNATRALLENAGSLYEEDTIAAIESFEKEMKPLRKRHAIEMLEEANFSLFNSTEDVIGSAGWLKVLNAAYGAKVPLTQSSFLLSDCFACVNSTMRLLATKKQQAPAYVFAHVLTEVGQFFYMKDDRGVTGASNAPSTCLKASYQVMPLTAWSNLYSNFSHSAAAADLRTEDLFERITYLASYAIANENETIANKNMISRAQSFLTVSRAQMFLYNATLSQATRKAGSLFDEIDRAIWENFPKLFLTAKTLEASRRLQDPVSVNQMVETSFLLKGRVIYHAMQNSVVLPPAMRRMPITYPQSVPVEYDLGTTGVLIAIELYRAATQSVSIDDASWAKWYQKRFRNIQDCFDDATVTSANFSQKLVTSESAFEMYVWKHAFRVVLDALRDIYSPRGGLGFSAETRWVAAQRTFFKRFCLLSCGGGGLGSDFDRKLRCVLPVLATSEFRDVFSCKKPQKKKLNGICSNL
ncbi:hypothetical protein V5799_026406 [Amblyomma americanum]|uniref:Uncharacterized protein n=1 Tax=Amblyomma americanum TaxID=6943 RepID=A0AAQ4DIN4_AMBAM